MFLRVPALTWATGPWGVTPQCVSSTVPLSTPQCPSATLIFFLWHFVSRCSLSDGCSGSIVRHWHVVILPDGASPGAKVVGSRWWQLRIPWRPPCEIQGHCWGGSQVFKAVVTPSCISGPQTHVGLVGEMPQFWYKAANICLAGLFLVSAIWSQRNVTHSARNRAKVYNKVTKLLQHFQLNENFFWKLKGRSPSWRGGGKFS